MGGEVVSSREDVKGNFERDDVEVSTMDACIKI